MAMPLREADPNGQRNLARWLLVVGALTVFAAAAAWFVQTTIPRRIVLATGLPSGVYHEWFRRYAEILARDGVTVVERSTAGADDNERLLHDPRSGVDAAFIPGGVVAPHERGDLVMLAALGYEPLWVFHRSALALTQVDGLRGKRIAIGTRGSGVRVQAETLLAANDVTNRNSELLALVNLDAVAALQRGEVDAALLLGPAQSRAVVRALGDPSLVLMSFERADAYPRRYRWLSRLTLPAGTIDLARRVPPHEVKMVGTKTMLVAREGLPPAIVDLLLNAARELHGEQGLFEAADEFPNTTPVDLPVSAEASRHLRFGPSLLHRYLPFFVATYTERLVVLLLPLLIVIAPLINILPQAMRWRARHRIYRWYGELKLLEREIGARRGELPIGQWLAALDRIEAAAARIRTPASYSAEAYTLREHINLVRRDAMAKAAHTVPAGDAGTPATLPPA